MVAIAKWQSTGGLSQRFPGFDIWWLLAFLYFCFITSKFLHEARCSEQVMTYLQCAVTIGNSADHVSRKMLNCGRLAQRLLIASRLCKLYCCYVVYKYDDYDLFLSYTVTTSLQLHMTVRVWGATTHTHTHTHTQACYFLSCSVTNAM